jgi:hypothetical protein
MDQHRGEILEVAIRKGPYSIKILAKKLGISRNTLYNRFKEPDLDYTFILQVGDLIHHDFKTEFSELKTTVPIQLTQYKQELRQIEKKYLTLLECYENLLGFLIRTTHEHGLEMLRKDLHKLATDTSLHSYNQED